MTSKEWEEGTDSVDGRSEGAVAVLTEQLVFYSRSSSGALAISWSLSGTFSV